MKPVVAATRTLFNDNSTWERALVVPEPPFLIAIAIHNRHKGINVENRTPKTAKILKDGRKMLNFTIEISMHKTAISIVDRIPIRDKDTTHSRNAYRITRLTIDLEMGAIRLDVHLTRHLEIPDSNPAFPPIAAPRHVPTLRLDHYSPSLHQVYG